MITLMIKIISQKNIITTVNINVNIVRNKYMKKTLILLKDQTGDICLQSQHQGMWKHRIINLSPGWETYQLACHKIK